MSAGKNIVVFGATGNTGLAVVETALKKGFQVTAFVRDPEKMPAELRSRVKLIQGDVTDKADVAKAVEGQDAVVVTLGTRNDLAPTTLMSSGTTNIIEAMKQHKVKRVSACISAFLFYEPARVPPRYKDITADHERQANILKASELEWIGVCPPHIADEPARGVYKVVHGNSPGRMISKFDLADLLLTSLDGDEHVNQMVGLGYTIE